MKLSRVISIYLPYLTFCTKCIKLCLSSFQSKFNKLDHFRLVFQTSFFSAAGAALEIDRQQKNSFFGLVSLFICKPALYTKIKLLIKSKVTWFGSASNSIRILSATLANTFNFSPSSNQLVRFVILQAGSRHVCFILFKNPFFLSFSLFLFLLPTHQV